MALPDYNRGVCNPAKTIRQREVCFQKHGLLRDNITNISFCLKGKNKHKKPSLDELEHILKITITSHHFRIGFFKVSSASLTSKMKECFQNFRNSIFIMSFFILHILPLKYYKDFVDVLLLRSI
jgi:hypothetical protein